MTGGSWGCCEELVAAWWMLMAVRIVAETIELVAAWWLLMAIRLAAETILSGQTMLIRASWVLVWPFVVTMVITAWSNKLVISLLITNCDVSGRDGR